MMNTTEWDNSTITFVITPNAKGGTDLVFCHADWKNESEFFKKCTNGWAFYLGESLKGYLENGEGKPFTEK